MNVTRIYKDYFDFSQRKNRDENGVSQIFADENPEFEKENETNKACWSCSDCSRCSGCSDLQNSTPVEQLNKESIFDYPIIENIHQKILDAVSKENALDMRSWHACETTHCRAGWTVKLAGERGKKLELETTTLFAAMQIYSASSDIKVSPTQFFKGNKEALEDIKKCAQLESNGR